MISVIVPVYNGAKYLPQCLDSILEQTYGNLELILMDDGSTDGAGDICDVYAGKDSRVKVVHKENEGLMRTWMRGVERSSAPYLFFVDGDDWVEKETLERLAAELTGNPKEIICSGYIIEREWNGTSEKKDNQAAAGVYEGEKLRTDIKERLLGNENRTLILSRCMKLFSRELIEQNMHFCDPSIRMGEDLNITVPALMDAERVVVMEDAFFYHYRFVQRSMVHQYDAGMAENMLRLKAALERIGESKNMKSVCVEREYLYLFLLTLKNEIRNPASAGSVVNRIQSLCKDADSQNLVRLAEAPFRDPANRLLAMIMKHPSAPVILAVRTVFRLKG